MNTTTLSPSVASAIETELAAIGTPESQLQRIQRRARRLAFVLGTIAGAAVLTGGAIVASGFPGETTTTPIGSVVTGTYTGTASVELGAAPADADVVILDVTCVEGHGVITVPLSRGESVEWDCDARPDPTHIASGRLPGPGSTSITIAADPGTQWTVTARYATTSTTEWGVNANGQTYGVANENGVPDLSPALATNGKVGYILNRELLSLGVGEEGFINVYESDGTTVIGQFFIGNS